MLKYSKQREAIKNYLMSTKEHPTADTVYLHVKEEFPNISLGTVYRNLNLLADIGEVTKISFSEGGDRFDGFTKPHYHFYCRDCCKLIDLDIDMSDMINHIASEKFDGIIESHTILFQGQCEECIKKS